MEWIHRFHRGPRCTVSRQRGMKRQGGSIAFGRVSFFFALSLGSVEGLAFENGDVQYWNLTQLQKSLSARWKAFFAEDLRWGDRASEFYFHRPEAGLVYRTSKSISFCISYKEIHTRESGDWKTIRIPNGSIIFDAKAAGLEVMNRNRLEFMDQVNGTNAWRYRGLVYAYFPWRLPWIGSQPYVGDELFYHFNGDRLKFNRIYAGLRTRIAYAIQLDTYYLIHHIRSRGEWTIQHVLGTRLMIQI